VAISFRSYLSAALQGARPKSLPHLLSVAPDRPSFDRCATPPFRTFGEEPSVARASLVVASGLLPLISVLNTHAPSLVPRSVLVRGQARPSFVGPRRLASPTLRLSSYLHAPASFVLVALEDSSLALRVVNPLRGVLKTMINPTLRSSAWGGSQFLVATTGLTRWAPTLAAFGCRLTPLAQADSVTARLEPCSPPNLSWLVLYFFTDRWSISMFTVADILDEKSLGQAFRLMVQLQDAEDSRNDDAIEALRGFISAQLRAMAQ
jgi:hypothetical protein